jgi:hypothetical protein
VDRSRELNWPKFNPVEVVPPPCHVRFPDRNPNPNNPRDPLTPRCH